MTNATIRKDLEDTYKTLDIQATEAEQHGNLPMLEWVQICNVKAATAQAIAQLDLVAEIERGNGTLEWAFGILVQR